LKIIINRLWSFLSSARLLVLLIALLSLSYFGLNIFLNIQAPSQASILAGLIVILLSTLTWPYLFRKRMPILCINAGLIIFVLLSLELMFYFKILENSGIRSITFPSKENENKITYLNQSPYIKFQANKEITSMGARGEDFTYTWKTDSLGFKNSQKILNKSKIDFIALGDSFTEGMGVATENTWTNILNNKYQITVYNAGVQGYSSSQMLGTLMLLKDKIDFQGVIIGALPGIYKREKYFIGSSKITNGTGGIESIRIARLTANNTFLAGFLRAVKNMLWIPKKLQNNRYLSEINTPDQEATLKVNPNWKMQLSNYKTIVNWAQKNKKKVYLIQFPQRHEVYFSESIQGLNSINETQYYVELTLLKKEFGSFIEIIDLYPPIKNSFVTNPKKLMYFKLDGHMNEYGQELVASSIFEVIKHFENH